MNLIRVSSLTGEMKSTPHLHVQQKLQRFPDLLGLELPRNHSESPCKSILRKQTERALPTGLEATSAPSIQLQSLRDCITHFGAHWSIGGGRTGTEEPSIPTLSTLTHLPAHLTFGFQVSINIGQHCFKPTYAHLFSDPMERNLDPYNNCHMADSPIIISSFSLCHCNISNVIFLVYL